MPLRPVQARALGARSGLGLIGGPESAAASGSGPVAAYSFDAGEGEVAEDVTGNAHDGEIEGAEWFDNGKFGSALSFDGENDCVTVADAPDLQLTEELTLEAWVKPQGAIPHDPVIYKQQEGYLSYSLQLGWGVDGLAEGYIGEDEENYQNVFSPDPLDANVWTHLAFTYDGHLIRLFVNGEEVADQLAPSTVLASNGALLIGCAPGEYFHGLIDEIRIYNRALGAGELQGTMTAGFPVAITEAATEVGANDAILNGTANANDGESEYFFEYGPTKSYGSVVWGEELGSDREAVEISEAVVDLEPETAYHYRLVAESSAGTAYGKDQTLGTGERAMSVEEEKELRDAEAKMDLTPSEKEAGPGDLYGMMWTGNLKKMHDQNIYEAVERSGAKMLHLGVGPGDQTEIDYAFKVAAESGITVVPGLGSGPFPKPGSPARTDWIEYAKKIVEKYGPGSSFSTPAKAWVIWNEPNMSHVDKVNDPEQQQGAVNPEGFASFFKEMSDALRSGAKGEIAKGEMEVLTPGLYGYRSPGCHPECHLTPRAFMKGMDEKLLELKSSNAYDAMALHPYVFKIGEHGKQQPPKNGEEVKEVTKVIKRVITGLHSLHSGKPLWITELGFPVANPEKAGNNPPVTPPIQKLLVKASFSMIQNNRKRLNIPHAFYYNIQDDPASGRVWDYFSGLLNAQGKPRPAWTAYSNLAGGQACPHAAILC